MIIIISLLDIVDNVNVFIGLYSNSTIYPMPVYRLITCSIKVTNYLMYACISILVIIIITSNPMMHVHIIMYNGGGCLRGRWDW